MVIMSTVAFDKAIILVEIDLNKIKKKVSKMINFYNSSNS